MLATVERIEKIESHPNADRLEIATARGYQCIIALSQFSIGELCVLIQPDTVLPQTDWAQKYKTNRVKAVRLRGEWSFGIVESLGILPPGSYEEGAEVGDILGIVKYESPAQVNNLDVKRGYLPFNIPKTDETRWQNMRDMPWGASVNVTLKIDGQSMTLYYKDGEVGVCGRTLEYKLEAENNYTRRAKNILPVLAEYCQKYNVNLALRGEAYGHGIQNYKHNPHCKLAGGVMFYSVWLIDEMRYVKTYELHNVFDVCTALGLETVPLVELDVDLTRERVEYYMNAKTLRENYFEGVVMVTPDGQSFKVINLHYDSKK